MGVATWLKDNAPGPVRRAAGAAMRRRTRSLAPKEIWDRAISNEAEYWRSFLAGQEQDVAWRIDPNAQVPRSSTLYRVLGRLEQDVVRILDVGSGPLTPVGHTYPGKRLDIVPTDPLAAEYDELLAEAGIEPPVRTIHAEGERLLATFEPESFDVAIAQNALDHCHDPVRVVSNMLQVVRPGGAIILEHRPNEAEHQLYRGLHQWNFDVRDGAAIMWNTTAERDLTDEFAPMATTDARLEGGLLRVILWRHA